MPTKCEIAITPRPSTYIQLKSQVEYLRSADRHTHRNAFNQRTHEMLWCEGVKKKKTRQETRNADKSKSTSHSSVLSVFTHFSLSVHFKVKSVAGAQFALSVNRRKQPESAIQRWNWRLNDDCCQESYSESMKSQLENLHIVDDSMIVQSALHQCSQHCIDSQLPLIVDEHFTHNVEKSSRKRQNEEMSTHCHIIRQFIMLICAQFRGDARWRSSTIDNECHSRKQQNQ